jgi:chromate transport protein ChrA
MSRKILKDYKSIAFAVIALICLAVFKFNPIVLIIAAAIAGVLMYRKER